METKPLVDRICIRARHPKSGEWGGFTLRECVEMGNASAAFRWALEKLTGYEEASVLTIENIERIVEKLDPSSYVALK